MSKVVFSADQLPADLDDEKRFTSWNELYSDLYCTFDPYRIDDRAFSARLEFAQFGAVKSSRFEGTVARTVRTSRHIAAGTSEDLMFMFNRSRGAIRGAQHGRELVVAPGKATLCTFGDTSLFEGNAGLDWAAATVSRQRLVEMVADPENLVLAHFEPNAPAIRHLERYLDIMLELDARGEDPALAKHIETTLLDLVALALGTGRDNTHLARGRGLRTARLQEVLASIKSGFADPAFSSEDAAREIGVSRRYVNDLLHETGSSFAERVLELRLQKARVMLADPRNDSAKIHDVAFACGFNEVSYFHRCFRRRFGAAPSEFRNGRDEKK